MFFDFRQQNPFFGFVNNYLFENESGREGERERGREGVRERGGEGERGEKERGRKTSWLICQ